jgi:hypothetical protein
MRRQPFVKASRHASDGLSVTNPTDLSNSFLNKHSLSA